MYLVVKLDVEYSHVGLLVFGAFFFIMIAGIAMRKWINSFKKNNKYRFHFEFKIEVPLF